MSGRYTRKEVVDRLRATIAAGQPILVACCGNGLIAKSAEVGKADIIMTACTSKSRLMGLPTTQMGYPNQDMLALFDEIDNVVKDTPIIAAVDSLDPTTWDLRKLLQRFKDVGYCGVMNYPTVGVLGEPRRSTKESVGLGFSREVEMMRIAREMDLFTLPYAFTVDDAKRMAEAGTDCIVPHCGTTAGGMAGARAATLEAAAKFVQEVIDACKAINPDIIPLAHGGPFATPEDTEYMYEHTSALGFVGASSIERIPIERAVAETVRQFKAVPVPKR